jgi:D-apionolactonase
MNLLPKETLYYGKPEQLPPAKQFQAGALTMLFEPGTGFLRYVRLGDHEIIRAIYAAVRDKNWNTIHAAISDLEITAEANHFSIRFQAVCVEGEIDFVYRVEITGTETGSLSFRFQGEARSDFFRNRIGICLLHPIVECAGKPCQVEKDDGSKEAASFPKLISPHQPFKNIRALTYQAAPGIQADIRFSGEIFETEDQRNWTDASFKTYGTPLDLPFPVQVQKGSRIEQSVELSLEGPLQKVLPILRGRSPQLSIATTPVFPKPALGLQMASHGEPLSPRQMERLQKLGLSHLRVDLHLADPRFAIRLRQAASEAAALQAGLQVALFLTDAAETELDQLREMITELQIPVSLWMIFHPDEKVTSRKWVHLARTKLTSLTPNTLFAAGANAYFAELNRNRPEIGSTALPCFSINPQVHATDHLSLIENLGAQPDTIETVNQFSPGAAVISPVTLRPRFNPNATEQIAPDPMLSFDARQISLLGAGWTLGSIARLATAGHIHSLTYYETTGSLGIMAAESPSPFPVPPEFLRESVFPIYHLLADLAFYNRIHPTHSSHPLQAAGLTLLNPKNQRRILVANFLPEPQEIKIKTGTCQALVRYLDETTAEEAMRHPEKFQADPGKSFESVNGKIELNLLPWALARVDILG